MSAAPLANLLGCTIIIYLQGVQNISQELRQGAAIDGASSWRGFRNAVLRLLSPSITALPVLTFIEIFRVLDVVYVLIRTLRRRETAI